MSREKQIEGIGEREKRQVVELANDLDRILHKYVDISPRQYASKEFSERYRDMGIDIDLVGITTDLLNEGYRKQSEGEWEIVIGSNGREKMVCTNCRHQQDLASTFTYCPNCGARMRGSIRK